MLRFSGRASVNLNSRWQLANFGTQEIQRYLRSGCQLLIFMSKTVNEVIQMTLQYILWISMGLLFAKKDLLEKHKSIT